MLRVHNLHHFAFFFSSLLFSFVLSLPLDYFRQLSKLFGDTIVQQFVSLFSFFTCFYIIQQFEIVKQVVFIFLKLFSAVSNISHLVTMAPLATIHKVARFMRTDFEYASLSLSPTGTGTGAIKGGESKRRMRPLGAKEILLSLQEIDPNSKRAAESLSSTTSSNLENSFPGMKKRCITNTTKTSKWHTFNSSEDFKQVPLVSSKTMPSHTTDNKSNEEWVRFEEKERSANPPKRAFVETTPLRKSRQKSLLNGKCTPSKVSANPRKRAFVETTPLRNSRQKSLLDGKCTPSKVSLSSTWKRSTSPDPSINQF